MQAKKMLLLVIIILILWIGLWIFIWSKNIVPLSKNLDKNTTAIVKKPSNTLAWTWYTGTWYTGTWAQVEVPLISYQDKKWTKIFTNEDDFLTWFITSWKSYNDIGNWINENGIWSNITGLNLAYILYNDFLWAVSDPIKFKSFFERDWFMETVILIYKEKNTKDILNMVPNVFDTFYQKKWNEFLISQNRVLWTVNLEVDELRKQTILTTTTRAKELFSNWYLKTDFEKAWMYDPVEVAVQDLPINKLKELCEKGVANKEYPYSYCMDFVYMYRSSISKSYCSEIKNNFRRNVCESYDKYGLKKVWE